MGIISFSRYVRAYTIGFLFAGMTLSACQCEDGLGVLNATVELEPAELDFEDAPLNNTKYLPLKIWNKGSFVLSVSNLSTAEPFIAPTLTTTIGIGYFEEVMVGFRPTELGEISGELQFETSDPDAPTVTVNLRGNGIEAAIVVEPSMVDFGDVVWKSRNPTPKTIEVTISNPGTDSFDLTEATLVDDGQGLFTLDEKMAVRTYAPGESDTVSVSFAPTSAGMHSGTLEIKNTTPSAPSIMVPLQGKGVGPVLDLCAQVDGGNEACSQNGDIPRMDMGFVDPASTGNGTVRARNVGDRVLEIDQILLTGTDEYFSFSPMLTQGMTSQLAPGEELTWDVVFTPDDYKPGTVNQSFTTNASNNNFSDVSGASSVRIDAKVGQPTIVVQPQTVTFSHVGSIERGETKVRIFSCGTKELVLSGINLRSTSGSGQVFQIQNFPMNGTSLAPQNCDGSEAAMAEFDVVFETNIDGNYSAEATISSNDPNTPNLTVTITGSKR